MSTRTYAPRTAAPRPITDKQEALIARLAGERVLSIEDQVLADARADLSTRAASQLIDRLFAAPRVPTAASAQAEPGYYLTDADEVIVVVANKAGTGTYAKRLTFEGSRAFWQYAPGVGRTLAGIEPLTVEQAARLGHLHGRCVVCTKALTDPASVERGIGPVCVRRLTR